MTSREAARFVLEAAGPAARQTSLATDDAAAIVAALALMALADEVLTPSERTAFVATLSRHFGLRVDPEAVCEIFERAGSVPRQLLLLEVEARCRGWPASLARAFMAALEDLVGADGYVARNEQLLWRRLAAALGVPEPPLASPVRLDSTVLARVVLREGQRSGVGRSLRAEICLPRAPIAAHQLDLVARGACVAFENVGESSLAVTQGQPVNRGELALGAELCIGRYRVRFEVYDRLGGYVITIVHPGLGTTIEARDVAVAIRHQGRRRQLLEGVSFRARGGEMVAIIGPSGSGKSTLLHVLRGDLAATRGRVSLDGVEVRPGAPAAARRISFVPQEELLLAALTVEEAVAYAAKLKGLDHSGRRGLTHSMVDEMLDRVGLAAPAVRRTSIGDVASRGISGGQRRRVSVAQELVGDDTDVLLLDEPTNGLDPKSAASVDGLLRELCDGGRIVISTTHAVSTESLRSFDRVVCLDARGRAAYVGPPEGLLGRLGAASVAELFDRLDDDEPAASAGGGDAAGRDVGAEHDGRGDRGGAAGGDAASLAADRAPPPAAAAGRAPVRGPRALGPGRQLTVLLRRELTVRLRDRVSLALALALPVAVAGLCAVVYYRGCIQPTLLFVLTLAGLWSGVSFTVRDIISQFAVLRHESRIRADLAPSLAAKAIVATGASAVQAGLLAASLFWVLGAHDAHAYLGWRGLVDHASLLSPLAVFLVLWACHVFGNALGFVLSASFRTAEAAIFMIPFVLLPAVAFSGTLVPPSGLPPVLRTAMEASPLYQGFVGLLGGSVTVCIHAPVDMDDPARTDRSPLCDVDHRTVQAPSTSERGRAPFVQSESSCLHNIYEFVGDFCHQMGLPCRPADSDDPIGRQLDWRLVGRSVGALACASSLLYVLALQISRRRMRTWS